MQPTAEIVNQNQYSIPCPGMEYGIDWATLKDLNDEGMVFPFWYTSIDPAETEYDLKDD